MPIAISYKHRNHRYFLDISDMDVDMNGLPYATALETVVYPDGSTRTGPFFVPVMMNFGPVALHGNSAKKSKTLTEEQFQEWVRINLPLPGELHVPVFSPSTIDLMADLVDQHQIDMTDRDKGLAKLILLM